MKDSHRGSGAQGAMPAAAVFRGIWACVAMVFAVVQPVRAGSLWYTNTVSAANSKNFTERWQNDGGMGNSLTVVVTNDAFTGVVGDDFVALGKVVPANVPGGLAATMVKSGTNQLVVSLTGLAVNNSSNYNVSNLGFTFADTAFTSGVAAGVANYNESDLKVIYLAQNPSNWYVNVTSGNDSTGNGTLVLPWATLTNALAKAQSGANDVINLAAGVYTASNTAVSKSVTIQGNSRDDTFIQPPATNGGIFVPTKSFKLRNVTLRNGRRADYGGAVYMSSLGIDLYADSCRFVNNAAGTNGGAIYVSGAANTTNVVSLTSVEATGNQATNNGGFASIVSQGVVASNCVFVANTSGNGGVFNVSGAGPVLVLSDTLMASNTATTGSGGACYLGVGRAIGGQRCTFAWNTAGVDAGALDIQGQAMAQFTNCTFSGNVGGVAGGGGVGGALWYFSNTGGKQMEIYNSTLFQNSAPTGGAVRSSGGWYAYSSIVAGNTASSGVGPDIYQASGNAVANYSLIGNKGANAGTSSTLALATNGIPNAAGSFVGTNTVVVDSGLLPLANNGGIVPTCALPRFSLAVDHGTNWTGTATDARGSGYLRVSGSQCDMGAYERNPVSGTAISF